MTFLSNLMALFPASVLLLTFLSLWPAFHTGQFWHLLWPLAVVYLYPVLVFRIMNLFWPVKTGSYNLAAKTYNPWWGSHQIQLVYFACPFLEALLRLVPGVYSAWLRLWGAKVGKGIYWTPNVEIADRSLVDIGDGVIFGHESILVSHVILPHKARISLYVQPVTIGSHSFIGAGSRLGPGVKVDEGVFLPVLTEGHVNQQFSKK